MAPVGRWQQGRDLQWYAKENTNKALPASLSHELSKVKQAEEEAMLVALGLKKANRGSADVERTKEEVSRIMMNMKKEEKESGLEEERDADIVIKGLGSKRTSRLSATNYTHHDVVPGNVPEKPMSTSKRKEGDSSGEGRTKRDRHAAFPMESIHELQTKGDSNTPRRERRDDGRSHEKRRRHRKRSRSPEHSASKRTRPCRG